MRAPIGDGCSLQCVVVQGDGSSLWERGEEQDSARRAPELLAGSVEDEVRLTGALGTILTEHVAGSAALPARRGVGEPSAGGEAALCLDV
jgi:hypothetical protein